MRWLYSLLCCFLSVAVFAQAGSGSFSFLRKKKKERIAFELINNLIVVPVWVNGQKLSFLLDTGVGKTLLFNNARVSKIYFQEKNAFQLTGLGQGASLTAYLTRGNTLQLGKIRGNGMSVLLVDENNFEFTKRMGTQIDGILGFDFFSQFPLIIDYEAKRITVYRSATQPIFPSQSRRYPIQFHRDKPHISFSFTLKEGVDKEGFFLIDTGSSDALWLFEQQQQIEKIPPLFEDYLGRGINGNIFGSRGKIHSINLAGKQLSQVKVAYPEMQNFHSIDMLPNRLGSVGGELLRRFTVYVDYSRGAVGLVPNRSVNAPFYFNLSGIELQYNGVKLVQRKLNNANNVLMDESGNNQGIEIFLRNVIRYELQDVIEVASVREGSPAAQVGIQKGDVLDRINGRRLHHLKLHQIIGLLQRKPGKKIKLSLRRQGELLTKKFVLRPLFNGSANL